MFDLMAVQADNVLGRRFRRRNERVCPKKHSQMRESIVMGKITKNPLRRFVQAAILVTPVIWLNSMPDQSFAAPLNPQTITSANNHERLDVTPVFVRRGGAVRRRTVVGPRGGVYHSRTAVRGGVVGRPGYRGGGVAWARPAAYGWPRGGAIAAGAAIGVATAATAAAWAGSPPAAGMCWYYTDPSRRQGFWDYCR
jgi:hypothetical protein